MKRLLWIALSIGAGYALARVLSRTEGGRKVVSSIDGSVREFRETAMSAYRDRQQQLRDAIGGSGAERP
jgi:hypothetical protein